MKLTRILKEIGFTNKKDYGFRYFRTTSSGDTAQFEFSSGDNAYRVLSGVKRAMGSSRVGYLL